MTIRALRFSSKNKTEKEIKHWSLFNLGKMWDTVNEKEKKDIHK